ncbi:MAG: SRPBCC domain-containing protein [Bacteroidia bacterium]|nr:SRPBCC domain-containing protein [Bacteroidia bacterium]
MKESMIITEEVLFKAAAEKVWDLLTNPAMTKQYMFGCELISDWEIGSPVLWKGKTEDGQEMIYVKGEVLEYEAGKKVVSTTFDPHAGMADIPDNYVQLSYEVESRGEGCLLKIVQGDFSKGENAQARFEESREGWRALVIPMMKELLGE